MTSSSSHERIRSAGCVAVLWAAVVAPAPAAGQGWQPYAAGRAFTTVELASTLTDEAAGGDGVYTSGTGSLLLGATLGLRWDFERHQGAIAYNGAFVSSNEDGEVSPDDVIQSFELRSSSRLAPRWTLWAGDQFFWGVLRVEQDLGTLGLRGAGDLGGFSDAPARGGDEAGPRAPRPAAPPRANLPSGETGGIDGAVGGETTGPEGATTAFAIHDIRFVRNGVSLGVSYDPSPFWLHSLSASFDFQYFVDKDLLERFATDATRGGRRLLLLFDTYTVGAFYTAEHRPARLHAVSLSLSGATTWFQAPPADTYEGPGLPPRSRGGADAFVPGANRPTLTQTAGARAGWRYNFAPRWTSEIEAGAEVFFPVDEPDLRRVGSVGSASLIHLRDAWQIRATASRQVQTSELGAVFVVTGAAIAALGRLDPRLVVEVTAAGSRQDAALIVVPSYQDPDSVEPDALEGTSIASAVSVDYLFDRNIVLTAAYALDQRFPDLDEAGTQLSHRVLFGLTIGTARSEVGGSAAAGDAAGDAY